MKFVSTVELKDEGLFITFKEAFTNFFQRIKKMLSEGTSWQTLETACWIAAYNDGDVPLGPLPFYESRDLAYQLGLMCDGELNECF